MRTLTAAMTKPRRAKPVKGHKAMDGWFFVGHTGIDVCTESSTDRAVAVVRITKRQLKRALEIMEGAE